MNINTAMNYYDDLRWKKNLRKLPLTLFKEQDQEKVMLFEISNYIPRVWKDLERMLEIDKTQQVTPRMTKLNSNSRKCSFIAAKQVIDEIETKEFSFLDKLEITILNTVKNLLKGNENKIEKTINTLETKKGQLMISIVCTYALGQELIKRFGEIESSKRLEATIITKTKYEEELRRIFKVYDFETAIMMFRDLVDTYQESFFIKKEMITQIAHEEYLYNIADLDDIRKNIALLTEKVRLQITAQPKLLIEY